MEKHLKTLIQEMRYNKGYTISKIEKEVIKNTGMNKHEVIKIVAESIIDYQKEGEWDAKLHSN